MVQFTTLQEVIAGWLGLAIGEYNQVSNSLHVYEQDLKYISRSSSEQSPVNMDSLAFPKKESDEYFNELAINIETIINESVPADELISIVRKSNLPPSFRNMLAVLCAEGIRRRSQKGVLNAVMNECTNPVYNYLYKCWLLRVGFHEETPPK